MIRYISKEYRRDKVPGTLSLLSLRAMGAL